MPGSSRVQSNALDKDQVKRVSASQNTSATEGIQTYSPNSRSGQLTSANILHMQQTIGNRAVQRMIAQQSATQVQRDDDQPAAAPVAAGQAMPTDDQTMQAAFGKGGTNAVQRNDNTSNQPAPVDDTPPTMINPQEVRPARYLPDGAFDLAVNWHTDARSGFIVQQIENQQSVTAVSSGQHAEGNQTYFEAWSVLPDSSASPTMGGVNDIFDRPTMTAVYHTATRGTWLKRGTVYWVSQLDPSAGFTPFGVRNAGLLMATMTRPGNLGAQIDNRTYTGRSGLL